MTTDHRGTISSPEILVRLEDGVITVRPIAGTRPRGRDEAEEWGAGEWAAQAEAPPRPWPRISVAYLAVIGVIAVGLVLTLVLAWIFSDRWQVVWQNDWIVPLLGILFLPFTTVMYMLAWQPAGPGGANIEGWDWMWIILGLILDLSKWAGLWGNREEATRQAQRYYPSGAPRYGSGGSTSALAHQPGRTRSGACAGERHRGKMLRLPYLQRSVPVLRDHV